MVVAMMLVAAAAAPAAVVVVAMMVVAAAAVAAAAAVVVVAMIVAAAASAVVAMMVMVWCERLMHERMKGGVAPLPSKPLPSTPQPMTQPTLNSSVASLVMGPIAKIAPTTRAKALATIRESGSAATVAAGALQAPERASGRAGVSGWAGE